MNKTEKLAIHKILTKSLTKSNKLWDEKTVSLAYIIGYLQGCIEFAIHNIEKDDDFKL